MKVGDLVVLDRWNHDLLGPFKISRETKTLWEVEGRTFNKACLTQYGGIGIGHCNIEAYDPDKHGPILDRSAANIRGRAILNRIERSISYKDLTIEEIDELYAWFAKVSKRRNEL